MADRTWSNSSERGAVEQVAGRTWANSGGSGAHEDQAVAPAGGRIMASLAGSGGLAGMGGIAGAGGGLAG